MTMFENIAIGSDIHVKITKRPVSVAAAKTLVRVLSKDPVIQARNKHLRKVRDSHYRPRMRGGRLYGGRMIKLNPITVDTGKTGTLKATLDVLNDLRSVSRFVEITPA